MEQKRPGRYIALMEDAKDKILAFILGEFTSHGDAHSRAVQIARNRGLSITLVIQAEEPYHDSAPAIRDNTSLGR